MTSHTRPFIRVSDLTVGYDGHALLRDISFDVRRGDIFVIMGGSGCGKSTLMRAMTGLVRPMSGTIDIDGTDIWAADADARRQICQHMGVLFQGGALFSSMTVGENVALPLRTYTDYSDSIIRDIVATKLALVGLAGFQDFYPSELSGGMKKRAGLARALALDAQIVFFDEPSAGLDPVSSRQLDDLILEINHHLGTTIVIVSHELESIFAVGTNSIFLDGTTHGIIARGNPRDLLRNPPNDTVRHFLTRGKQ
ncbi:MAG: ATP-binding cassette domain-containing protein [Alphaproteobacteria bacterium]|nr:ATP-binding cassette domain-containing protein [Alphaproteobacteria bacterium]